MNATIADAMVLGVTEISKAVKGLAPEVWRIMIRQQYANGIGFFLLAIFFGITALVIYRYIPWINQKIEAGTRYEDWDVGKGFMVAGIVVSLIVMMLLLIFSIKIIINPEYYAIHAMMNMVM